MTGTGIHSMNPGRAATASASPPRIDSGKARGRRPGAGGSGPNLITIDPQDWIDPDEVDTRDVRDPLLLASMVLVAAHVGSCRRMHSPDCEAATVALGHRTFDELVVNLGIRMNPDGTVPPPNQNGSDSHGNDQ